MGEYFVIVNKSKKEFIDPDIMGDGNKFFDLFSGLHGRALAMLLTDERKRLGNGNELFGSWVGDLITIIGDETELPSSNSKCDNYYEEVCKSYKNISIEVLAMLFVVDPGQAVVSCYDSSKNKDLKLAIDYLISEFDMVHLREFL